MQLIKLQEEKLEELKASFLNVFSKEPWFDKWDDDQQLDLYIRDLVDNNNSLPLLLVDDQGKILGASLGYVFHWWQGNEYFIKELFISREKQNQGLGKLFLQKINDYIKSENVQHITLMTERDVPAYSFYQHNGFTELEDSVYFAKKVK